MLGGGAEKAFSNLSLALIAKKHHVTLFTLENRIEYTLSEEVDYQFLLPETKKLPNSYIGKRILAAKLRRLYERLNKKNNFDVVISTLPFADEIVTLAKIPNVWFRIANHLSTEVKKLQRSGRLKKAKRRLKRYQNMYANKNLIAVSAGVKNDLVEFMVMPAKEIRVIRNIYDFEKIREKSCVDNKFIPAEPYLIHIGRFSPQKRHDLLLQAFSQIESDYKLVLLTHPNADLTKMIEKLQLQNRVVVAGFQANPYCWIKNSELLILCSDHEGLPNVLVEALIIGTKVVSTRAAWYSCGCVATRR